MPERLDPARVDRKVGLLFHYMVCLLCLKLLLIGSMFGYLDLKIVGQIVGYFGHKYFFKIQTKATFNLKTTIKNLVYLKNLVHLQKRRNFSKTKKETIARSRTNLLKTTRGNFLRLLLRI